MEFEDNIKSWIVYDNEIKELNKLIDFYRESWLND